MAQGKKTTPQDKAKVIVAKLEDPNKSARDIEKETWVWKNIVAKTIKVDLVQLSTEDETIKGIIADDLETVQNMARIAKKFTKRLSDKEEIERADIETANRVSDSSFKRHQLFNDKPTENTGLIWIAGILNALGDKPTDLTE